MEQTLLLLLMGVVAMNFVAFVHYFANSKRSIIGSLLVCLPNLYCLALVFFALWFLRNFSSVSVGEPVVATLPPRRIIIYASYFGLTALSVTWFGRVYRASWPRIPIQLFTAGMMAAALQIIATDPD